MFCRVTFVVMIASLAFGCDSTADKRAAQLQSELATLKSVLAEVESKMLQSQLSIEELTRQLVRVKVERDKLKQELAALAKTQ